MSSRQAWPAGGSNTQLNVFLDVICFLCFARCFLGYAFVPMASQKASTGLERTMGPSVAESWGQKSLASHDWPSSTSPG